jgi:long-chain acyl-CoA synthetase
MFNYLNQFCDSDILLADAVNAHNKQAFIQHLAVFQQGFNQLGLKAGDRLGILLSNRVEFIELLLAAIASGLKVFPINWHLHPDEITSLIKLVEIDAVISEQSLADLFQHENHLLLEQLTAPLQIMSQANFTMAKTPGNIVLFTGGTTGLPKAVERKAKPSFNALEQDYQNLGRQFGLTGEGAHLITGPLYHAAPLFFALYDFFLGAKLIIQPRFDVDECWRLLATDEVQRCHLVATQMIRLLQNKPADSTNCTMQLILHGAAPTPKAVKQAMIDCFGPVLTEYWGGSESGIVCKISSREWLKRPNSVGCVLDHYQLKVVSEENTQQLMADGELGLLKLRHSSGEVPFRYLPNVDTDRDTNNECIDNKGWFDLGDLGFIEDGYVYIAERQKSKILSAGVNIYPTEVESFLLALPAINDAVVLGLDDAHWGQKVAALIASDKPEAEILPLIEQHLQGLSAFKRPKAIAVLASLPRKPNGKLREVDLNRLIDKYFAP